MKDAHDKKLEKDQETIKPEGTKEESELQEKDLDKVAGGPIYVKYEPTT